MGSLRQRHIAIGIIFATLALTALFLAQGSTRLVAAAALDLSTSEIVPGDRGRGEQPQLAAGSKRERKDPTRILKRNIFDSEAGDLTKVPEPDEPELEEGEPELEFDPDAPPPDCEGSIRLVGSVVSERRPSWSFAAIVGSSGKATLYRNGMDIEGQELLAIQLDRVLLAPPDGLVCQLAMFAPEGDGASKRKRRVRVRKRDDDDDDDDKSKGNDSDLGSSELAQGIERVSDTEFNVERGLVDKILQNQGELMRTARIIPHEKNGKVVGVKLYGIRRSSLLGKLGLNNGDMLRTINGYDMTSPDKALEAYTKLRGADNLTVAVERRGNNMTIDYNIQ